MASYEYIFNNYPNHALAGQSWYPGDVITVTYTEEYVHRMYQDNYATAPLVAYCANLSCWGYQPPYRLDYVRAWIKNTRWYGVVINNPLSFTVTLPNNPYDDLMLYWGFLATAVPGCRDGLWHDPILELGVGTSWPFNINESGQPVIVERIIHASDSLLLRDAISVRRYTNRTPERPLPPYPNYPDYLPDDPPTSGVNPPGSPSNESTPGCLGNRPQFDFEPCPVEWKTPTDNETCVNECTVEFLSVPPGEIQDALL